MDLVNIFKELRQKGIDANQIDILKSAYEHQNCAVEQLKENNAALRESNDLLKEKIKQLEDNITQVKSEAETLKKKLPVARNSNFSDEAVAVLKVCANGDLTEFYENEMISLLQKGEIVAKKAMGELRSGGLIIQSRVITDRRGAGYSLTQRGLESIAKLSSSEERNS